MLAYWHLEKPDMSFGIFYSSLLSTNIPMSFFLNKQNFGCIDYSGEQLILLSSLYQWNWPKEKECGKLRSQVLFKNIQRIHVISLSSL